MEGIIRLQNNNVEDIDVSNAIKGNGDAFCRLINNNKLSMYRIAKSILKNEYDVEDAISDTILKAYTNIVKLRRSSTFKQWVFKILINECYSTLKKKKRETVSDVFDNMKDTYEDNYKDFELARAIDSLEENQRIVTVLYYYEDMSLKDISRTLDWPEGTVKSRLSRAKERLRSLINY
ncbi:MAG: sigma-70 family RNA polymerase sigma factor [Bacillota bacterium]|nr:sigma-70 family RNA polymerase sigma factor [Bacillota bacterium]